MTCRPSLSATSRDRRPSTGGLPRTDNDDRTPSNLANSCSAAGDLSVEASSVANNAKASAFFVADNPANVAGYVEDDDLDSTDSFDFLGASDDDVAGTLVYRAPGGPSSVKITRSSRRSSCSART